MRTCTACSCASPRPRQARRNARAPMRERLAEYLDGVWYGGRRVPLALRALECVYAWALALRRRAYAAGWFRSEALRVPVVVVGNVTVGGTGKTPLVVWLVRELAQRGWNPGVVLRGYGGSSGRARRVDAADAAADVGDEALVVARATGVPV